MHEVPDNQRGLDQRQSHQYGQHLHGLHVLIGQVDFDGGHQQQGAPDVKEKRFVVMALLFGGAFRESYLSGIHSAPVPKSLRTSDKPTGKLTSRLSRRSAST